MVSIKSVIAILSYGIVICALVPLYPWLGMFPKVLLPICFAASVWQDRYGSWAIKNWLLNLSLVPLFLFYASRFSRTNAVDPIVSLLAVMLAVRLLSDKNSRHYLQIYVLALFCLSSSSLFELSPSFLVYLALMLFLVAVSLVLMSFYDADNRLMLARADMRRVVGSGLMIPLAALPLLALLFPILPRTQYPMWNFLAAPASGVVSFADSVEPGNRAAAAEARVLAFRAESPKIAQGKVYWRGTVFNTFDGKRWIRDPAVPLERASYGFPRVSQTLFQEPGLSRFMMSLDAPASMIGQRIRRNSDGTYEMFLPPNKRITYQVFSEQRGFIASPSINREFYLRLPASFSPKIRRLAVDVAAKGRTDKDKIALVEGFFINGRYRYALSGMPTGENALETFIFQDKQGNCEFFASAFALMLRSAGVPARLVGGYLGGDYNELGGYYLVTQNMAHVWVEAHLDGKGWMRIDPSAFAENGDAVLAAQRELGVMKRLRMAVDSLDHVWNRSVVAYDLESQMEMAQKAGKGLHRLARMGLPKGGYWYPVAGIVVVAVVMVWRKRHLLLITREKRLLNGFLKIVERDCRIAVSAEKTGLFDIAAAAADPRVSEFVGIYAAAVYKDRKLTPAEYERLKELLKAGFRR